MKKTKVIKNTNGLTIDNWESFPFKISVTLAVILLVAFCIRVIGINHGFSDIKTIPWSEEAQLYIVMNFWKEWNFKPTMYSYGQLYMYLAFFTEYVVYIFGRLFGVFSSFADFTVRFITDTWIFYLLARINSLIFGLGTIYTIFIVGKKYFNEKAGILTAVFLTFAPLHIAHSHYYYPDIYAAFFVITAFIPIYMICKTGELKYYIYSGILIGLGAGTKFFPGAMVIQIFMAHMFFISKDGFSWKKVINANLMYAMVLSVVFFFLSSPYSFINFFEFKDVLNSVDNRPAKWLGFENTSDIRLIYHFTFNLPNAIGTPLVILGLAGIIYSFIENRKETYLLSSFFFIYLALVERSGQRFAVYMISVLPFLLLFASYLLVELFKKIKLDNKLKNILLAVLTVLIVTPNAYSSIKNSLFISNTNSRITAVRWIEKNIPRAATIIGTTYSAPVLRADEVQQIFSEPIYQNEEAKEKLRQFILTRPIYRVANLPWVAQYYNLDMLSKTFEYIMIDSGMYGRHKNAPDVYPVHVKFYNDLDARCELIKEIPGEPEFPGPTIKIYKVLKRRK